MLFNRLFKAGFTQLRSLTVEESEGKRAAREAFYRGCLPQWLTPSQLRSGCHLILLGDQPREMPYLDEIGVPRNHIWSVENHLPTYRKQEQMNLGISLYSGELVEYLDLLLHAEQRFVCLNLDIEGSYLNNIDHAMSSVLLYCYRYAETVVATYASIGRDSRVLFEGLKSLLIFLLLLPKETKDFVAKLRNIYQQAAIADPMHMVLRDLFWLRSMMEHSCTTSSQVTVCHPADTKSLLTCFDLFWESAAPSLSPPLDWNGMLGIVRELRATVIAEDLRTRAASLQIGMQITRQQHVFYRAAPPWSHRPYYVTLKSREPPVNCLEWIRMTMRGFFESPFNSILRDGAQQLLTPSHLPLDGKDAVCTVVANRFSNFVPRQLQIEPHPSHRRTIVSIINSRRHEMPSVEEEAPMAKKKPPKKSKLPIVFVRKGELTDEGRAELKKLASEGLSVTEIQAKVPKSVPERNIRAYVAVANRKK